MLCCLISETILQNDYPIITSLMKFIHCWPLKKKKKKKKKRKKESTNNSKQNKIKFWMIVPPSSSIHVTLFLICKSLNMVGGGGGGDTSIFLLLFFFCGGWVGVGGWGGLSFLHAEELLPFLRIMTLFLCWDVFIGCQQ